MNISINRAFYWSRTSTIINRSTILSFDNYFPKKFFHFIEKKNPAAFPQIQALFFSRPSVGKPASGYFRSKKRAGSMTDHAYNSRSVWEVKLWRQRVIDNVERRTGHYVWMFEGKQAAINSRVHRGCSSRRGMTSSGRCAENAPACLSASLSVSICLYLSPFVCLCIYIWIRRIQKARYCYLH